MKMLLMLVLLILAADRAESQIVYTDVMPDSTVSASTSQVVNSYFIDLDNDGVYEMELRHFNPDPDNIAVELHHNRHSTVEPQVLLDVTGHARAFGRGIVISSSSEHWVKDYYGSLHSPWLGSGDRFLGIRFKRRGEWHYGWARVSIPADASSFTIKDYAYEEMVHEPIQTGSGITGMHAHAPGGVTVRFNASEEMLVLSYEGRELRNITVLDMLGRTVRHAIAGVGMTRIDTHGLASGTYFLVLLAGRGDARVLAVRL